MQLAMQFRIQIHVVAGKYELNMNMAGIQLCRQNSVTREYHVTLRNHTILGGKNNRQQRKQLGRG
jgi:hypothetical protein